MKEAIVFEATTTKKCVEGVQRLLPLHGLGVGAVDVGGALRGKRVGVRHLRQLPVPIFKKRDENSFQGNTSTEKVLTTH